MPGFLCALSSAGSRWALLRVECCCAGYLLAGRCHLVFWSLLVPPSSGNVRARAHALHHPRCPPSSGSSPSSCTVMHRRRFSQAALSSFNNPLRILSESIYLPYLYSPSLMTDSRHTVLPLTISLTTPVPHSLQPLYTHYIHNYNRIIPKYAVQNNPSCCIQYISQIMFYVTSASTHL